MSIDTHPQGSRDIVSRVRAILASPKTEWPLIAAEPATVADLYRNYILIIAAIPAVAGFIQTSILGVTTIIGTYRAGVFTGLVSAIASYILTLVGIFIIALLIDALAPTFGGVKNQVQALKAAGYSFTASAVASIFEIIPGIGFLFALIGLIYSVYLLYLGLPFTTRAPSDRAVAYTAVVFICTLLIGVVLSFIVTGIAGNSAAVASFGGATKAMFPGMG